MTMLTFFLLANILTHCNTPFSTQMWLMIRLMSFAAPVFIVVNNILIDNTFYCKILRNDEIYNTIQYSEAFQTFSEGLEDANQMCFSEGLEGLEW